MTIIHTFQTVQSGYCQNKFDCVTFRTLCKILKCSSRVKLLKKQLQEIVNDPNLSNISSTILFTKPQCRKPLITSNNFMYVDFFFIWFGLVWSTEICNTLSPYNKI